MDLAASPKIQLYFDTIETQVQKAFAIAKQARTRGLDPTDAVDVKLAKNLAERVVGLISVVAPQIGGSGVVEKIIELEKIYGSLDWRVAMVIAHEVALQKFCTFSNTLEAIEVGIRIGFAYVTVGVVSSPLEGFTKIELKKRRDTGKEYFAMHFAGPIRNAGGTAAAVSVIIADYVRKKMGFSTYDADQKEQERCYTELMDYHERVTNLQYVPSKEEAMFMVANCPIEIDGDASESFEVSNFKDLPRIKTNRIRSGYCLILSSCLPLKAKKLWKNLAKWIDKMDMQEWKFMEQFLEIQKKATSKSETKIEKKEEGVEKTLEEKNVYPIYTYITDLVGGRPVIGHPIRAGGLRLRYGRSRVSGFSAQSIHPATMHVLDNFVAIATQLKVERPGKAAAFTSCDHIEGPIVLLENGDVVRIETSEQAKELNPTIKKILYLGDVLINYGDFFDRAHTLLAPGYCEEWWIQELEESIKQKNTQSEPNTQSESLKINNIDNVHFLHSPYAKNITPEDLALLEQYTKIERDVFIKLFAQPLTQYPSAQQAIIISQVMHIPLHPRYTHFWKLLSAEQFKNLLNGLSQAKIVCKTNNDPFSAEYIIPYKEPVKKALEKLGMVHKKIQQDFLILSAQDTYILQTILPQNAITKITLAFEQFTLTKKNTLDFLQTVSPIALRDKAGVFIGARMGRPEKAKMRKIAGHAYAVAPQQITDKTHPDPKMWKTTVITEHNAKAQLREKYQIHVNKDGTVRYDGSEVPITHFKPREINVSVAKLQSLGYTVDIYGHPLSEDNQIVELFAQDIILPCCMVGVNEPADEILYRVCNFVDDLLETHYQLPKYYNVKTKNDLVGHYLFCLAPHTSAATIGRIVGFSASQGLFCHPMMHAAMRRDCDGDETCVFMLMDGLLNFSTKFLPQHRGGTMDAPLVLTSIINPKEVDDMVFNLDIVWKYSLDFYKACCEYKKPWDIKIKLFGDTLGKIEQFEAIGFTHDTYDFNEGVLCSSYKLLPSMAEKVEGQMKLAEKIDAVDERDVAQIVINKHFLRDTLGNLRKFTQQEFRCVKCNQKYRRPPISGKCQKCQSTKIIFTISKGSVIKYLELSKKLGKKYDISPYTQMILELLQFRVDGIFGKDAEKQTGLNSFFS